MRPRMRCLTRFPGCRGRGPTGVSIVTAVLLATACETERLEPGWELHPTEENAPPPDAIALTDDAVPPGLAGEPLEGWLNARTHLMRAHTVVSIGSEEEGPELFGEIRDARIDQDGRIAVLDYQARSVRLFGPGGDYLNGFGEYGEGPMEWKTAYGLELLGPNRLAVFVGGRRAKVFVHHAGEWQLDDIVDLPVSMNDNCALDDRLFLHGFLARPADDHTLFYEVSELGNPDIVRYGRGYQDDFFMVRAGLSEGGIACVPAFDQVVFAFQMLPSVRSYSGGTGELLWTAYVENYIQQEIHVDPVNGAMKFFHGLPNDYLATVLAMASGHVVLQYQRYGEMSDLKAVRTYLLDPATGHGSLISEDLPEIQSFYEGGYVASFEDPHPRLEVRAFP